MRLPILSIGALLAVLLVSTGCASSEMVSVESEGQQGAEIEQKTSSFRTGDTRTITIPGTEVSFALVFVEGGAFEMGSPPEEEGRTDDEGPRRETRVDGYWIGKFEVTDNEFSVFRYADRDADTTAVPGAHYSVDAVSRPSPPYEDPAFGMGGSGKPAVGMTQWGALHFAKWMTQKTGIFFRLPTEAEWEMACRAGSDSAWSFGSDVDNLGDYAWFDENSDYVLHSVGEKRPNNWGIHDMHGNASEWTMDEYDAAYFTSSNAVNPWVEPSKLHPRTVRGGAFDDPAFESRCANRLESTLNWKRRDPQIPKSFWWNTDSPFLGFRLVAPENGMSEDEQLFFWTMVLGE